MHEGSLHAPESVLNSSLNMNMPPPAPRWYIALEQAVTQNQNSSCKLYSSDLSPPVAPSSQFN